MMLNRIQPYSPAVLLNAHRSGELTETPPPPPLSAEELANMIQRVNANHPDAFTLMGWLAEQAMPAPDQQAQAAE